MEFIKKIRHFILKLVKNPAMRLWFSLSLGLIINFVYLAGNVASMIIYRSLWSGTVTFYHLVLMIIRFYILYTAGRDQIKCYKACAKIGIFLFVLDLLAALMMVYAVKHGINAEYNGVFLFFFFAYTVYSVTNSILGMRKWKNDNKPLHYAAKNMTFASSLMSVFNLQFSIFSTLGLHFSVTDKIISIGGFSVFFIMIFLSFRLIMRGVQGSLR